MEKAAGQDIKVIYPDQHSIVLKKVYLASTPAYTAFSKGVGLWVGGMPVPRIP